MVWVAYLDSRQGGTLIMIDLDDKVIVLEWLENKIYSQEGLLTVVRHKNGDKRSNARFLILQS
jgi:hypothetical protein